MIVNGTVPEYDGPMPIPAYIFDVVAFTPVVNHNWVLKTPFFNQNWECIMKPCQSTLIKQTGLGVKAPGVALGFGPLVGQMSKSCYLDWQYNNRYFCIVCLEAKQTKLL